MPRVDLKSTDATAELRLRRRTLPQTVQVIPAPTAQVIANFISGHREWIEQLLGTTLGETVTLGNATPFGEVIAAELLAGIELYEGQRLACQPFQQLLERWQIPPALSPRIHLSRCSGLRREERVAAWSLVWQECPIALWLKGIACPIIAINVP